MNNLMAAPLRSRPVVQTDARLDAGRKDPVRITGRVRDVHSQGRYRCLKMVEVYSSSNARLLNPGASQGGVGDNAALDQEVAASGAARLEPSLVQPQQVHVGPTG